ncbi:MAG TPA: anthranilate phosphoribosyltransferase [Thermoanaerobaculia bacterium]|nr:anthranilate phosphoribosyltransferase [Thermoanaerobaculia bacterium]
MSGGGPLREALGALARGRRLSREESRAAFAELFDAPEPGALAAAFVAALAVHGETAEDVSGLVDVLRARAGRPPVEDALARQAVDVCGTGGDGLSTLNVSTATAFVVAGAGVPVAKHGGRAVSSTCGSADVLGGCGVDIEMPPARAAEALRRAGIGFFFAPLYHAAMKKVAPLRRELGIRTAFNLAGPLCNPVGVTRQLVGVDRPERIEVVAGDFARLGAERVIVTSNEAGGDELLPIGVTHAAEVTPQGIRRFDLSASDFGLAEGNPAELTGGGVERNVGILRAVLDGEYGTRRETVLMNAAAVLVVAGRAGDFREGVGLAAASLDGGAAREALLLLTAISRGAA